MGISRAGRLSRTRADTGTRRAGDSGVTLIELLIVLAIVGLIAGISFPSVSAGLESIRLRSASNSVVSFLNGALNRAERREEAMEIVISPNENLLVMYSAAPGFERKLHLPDGVVIEAVFPELEEPQEGSRQFLLIPGGVPPRIGVQLRNRRGSRRIVRVDPITGVPQIEVLETK
jgi:prepilin-type N-terminal cleavage/methylation domain-containing protein